MEELRANKNKSVTIVVENEVYLRYAINTHYIQIGEDYIELIKKYVDKYYLEGDILSISEKIISLCQKRVIYKKDMKVGWLAKFLSKFAMKTDAGIGVNSPYKMQFAIDLCGMLKVLFAAICSGIGKIFHKKGIFYKIVGMEVTGLDGFYGKEFPEYADFGILIPEKPNEVCNEIEERLGIKAMIVDANDFDRVILGKSDGVKQTNEFLEKLIEDNPSGQSRELTPFVLIRQSIN
ncbi:MAG: F420-0--gamma-glutamyl ligase [Clostridia bacterium]